MAFPQKPPMQMAQIGAAIGMPPGKKMSVRNLARLKPGKPGKGVARRPKAPPADDGDHEYR
ncbi:MAG: hypothetical protein M3N13_02910 [Candidatus Eremiobacteraeota bacterium]|nr:hypothetical protein [Candidatus Eremiobacteraeota bacterium]